MCREVAIKRAPCNSEASTDTLHGAGAGLVELERDRERVAINRFGAAAAPAPATGAGQASYCLFPHEAAFKFRKRTRDLKEELPRGCRGINRLDQALEPDLLIV